MHMDYLINQGKALYWGTSEWSAQEITEAHTVASGLLTGKYSGRVIPAGSRLSFSDVGMNAELKRQYESGEGLNGLDITDPDEAVRIVDTLKPLAARLGCSLAQLGLAWTLKNPSVSTTICGASRPEQMEENLKALEIVPKLTPDVMQEIDKLLGNSPALNKNWGRGVKRAASAPW